MRLLSFLLSFLICGQGFAAFDAASAWYYRTGGNSGNGGGFKIGATGNNYANQDSAQITHTDLVIDGADSTKATSAGNPFTSSHVGNVENITSGTGFTVQRAQITAVAAGVATFDKSLGTLGSTGGNGKLGGALDVPTDALWEIMVAGNSVYLGGGSGATYTVAAAISMALIGSQAAHIKVIGYNSSPDDNPTEANYPTIAMGANTMTLNRFWDMRYLNFTGTATVVLQMSSFEQCFERIKVLNSSGTANRIALDVGSGTTNFCHFANLQSTNGYALNGGANTDSYFSGIITHDSVVGYRFTGGSGCQLINCISDTNTTGYSDGGGFNLFYNCTFYGGTTGVSGTTTNDRFQNCIFSNISGTALSCSASSGPFIDKCNFYSNGTDVSNGTKNSNCTSLDPGFADAANQNFQVGTNMKAAASPAAFGTTTNNYFDLGAVQRQEPTGGGSYAWAGG